MRSLLILTALLITSVPGVAQTIKFPLRNAILQSDMDAEGYGIIDVGKVILRHVSSVTTPPADSGAIYIKSDGKLYTKNPAGTESQIISAGDTGTITTGMVTDGTLLDADISNLAAINLSKLAVNPLARANHTGLQNWLTIIGAPLTSTQGGDNGGGAFGGDGGFITLNGGSAFGVHEGGNSGSIDLRGGDSDGVAAGGIGGSVLTFGNGIHAGGSLNLNATSSGPGGSISTQNGGSLTMGTANLSGGSTTGTILTTTGDGSGLTDIQASSIIGDGDLDPQLISGAGATSGMVLMYNGSSFVAAANNPAIVIGSTAINGTAGNVLFTDGTNVQAYATTGTGNVVRATSPALVTPNLGTPSTVTLTNGTGLPLAGVIGAAGLTTNTYTGTQTIQSFKIGAWPTSSPYSIIYNAALDGVSNYAVMQSPAGETWVNAVSGGNIYFAIGHSTRLSMNANGFSIPNGVGIGFNGLAPINCGLYPFAGSDWLARGDLIYFQSGDGSGRQPMLVDTRSATKGVYFTGRTQAERYYAGSYQIGEDTGTPKLTFVGDSNTTGVFAGTTWMSTLTVPTWNGQTLTQTTVADTGRTLKQMVETSHVGLNPSYGQFSGLNIACVWGGTNDIALGASAETTYGRLKELCGHLKRQGWLVIVGTCVSRVDVGFEAEKNDFNALVEADWPRFADGIAVMPSTITADGAHANATYFLTGGTHLNATGLAEVASAFDPVIDSLISSEGPAFLTDGGKGDVAVSAAGKTFTISSGAVTNAKLADATLTEFGNLAAAGGVLTNNGSDSLSYTATSVGGNDTDDFGKLAKFGANGELQATSSINVFGGPDDYIQYRHDSFSFHSGGFNTSLSFAPATVNHSILVPNVSGTMAVSASGNIAINASTGNITFTGVQPSTSGGTGVNNAGTITNAANTTITGGGTLALGGFTATVPETMTVAGRNVANTFTSPQSINLSSTNVGFSSLAGYSLTGSNSTSAAEMSGTWNTSGTPIFFKINVTDTASNAASLLTALQVGGTTRVAFPKRGAISFPDSSSTAMTAPGVGNWVGTLGIFGSGGALAATVSGVNINLSSSFALAWGGDTHLNRIAVARFGLGASLASGWVDQYIGPSGAIVGTTLNGAPTNDIFITNATTTGSGSGAESDIVFQRYGGGSGGTTIGPTSDVLRLTGEGRHIPTFVTAPISAVDTGEAGEIRMDSNYIYRCTATNTWKRAPLDPWTSGSKPPVDIELTAWVEPDGNDTTGTVGDPARPFLTFQAAYNAGAKSFKLGEGSFGALAANGSVDIAIEGMGLYRSSVGDILAGDGGTVKVTDIGGESVTVQSVSSQYTLTASPTNVGGNAGTVTVTGLYVVADVMSVGQQGGDSEPDTNNAAGGGSGGTVIVNRCTINGTVSSHGGTGGSGVGSGDLSGGTGGNAGAVILRYTECVGVGTYGATGGSPQGSGTVGSSGVDGELNGKYSTITGSSNVGSGAITMWHCDVPADVTTNGTIGGQGIYISTTTGTPTINALLSRINGSTY